MQAAGSEPEEAYLGADAPWRCVCLTCGTVGTPRLSGIERQGQCKPCGRKRANAVTNLDPDVAAAAMGSAGSTPLERYPGSKEP